MKKTLCLLALCALTAAADDTLPVGGNPLHTEAEGVSLTEVQDALSQIAGTPAPASKPKGFVEGAKLGGYIIGKAGLNNQKDAKHSDFDLRLVRLYLNGYAFTDFYYRLQMEVNGTPDKDNGPRIVDAFIEWQHFQELRIKLGQYKRPFGFENPTAPWDIGTGGFSQLSNKMAGITKDPCGQHKSGGRDVGMQLQGDFFPAGDGHRWLHYQVGFFNGQGINHADKDTHKDLIGGLWLSPVKNLRIGWFGWNGKYVNESYNAAAVPQSGVIPQASVIRKRWAAGVDYESNWVFRAEYGHSVGGSVTNIAAPDRADTWYATIGIPATPKLKLYPRWDVYREKKQWKRACSIYGLSANYNFHKNFKLQLNYSLTNDRTAADRLYNALELQVYARF